MVQKKAGILLSGCGSLDGSDPYEVVSCVITLESKDFKVIPLAIDSGQFHCVDHGTGKEIEEEQRNQFVEASRLSRLKIYNLKEIAPSLLDVLILPGGQGSIKNLMTGFGSESQPSPVPEIAEFLKLAHDNDAVIGALSLGEFFVTRVLYQDQDNSIDLLSMKPGELVVDKDKNVVFSPGSLNAGSSFELHSAIEKFISAITELSQDPK